jgi:hypothetical protein
MIRSLVILVAASYTPAAMAFVSSPIAPAVSLASISAAASSSALFGYVPDGLTKEQWEKMKKKEQEAKKNLGRVGPRGFKSRSMQSFQEALERGEASHLMPVFNAKERIAKGELKKEDIPYMQRGGAWVRVCDHLLLSECSLPNNNAVRRTTVTSRERVGSSGCHRTSNTPAADTKENNP